MDEEPPQAEVSIVDEEVETHLPMEERDDGTLVIDLAPLGQTVSECEQPEPDPINPEIVVCRKLDEDQRIAETPETDDFGNAIPRAQARISENATISLDAAQKGVGGIPANAAQVTVTIEF